MARTSTHVIELNSKDCVRSRINSFGDNGDYIFRELSERDYGIDALIECFDGGVPTGKIAFLQIKGDGFCNRPTEKNSCSFLRKYIGIQSSLC